MGAPTYVATTISDSPVTWATYSETNTRTTPSYSPAANTILVGGGATSDSASYPITSISGGPIWTQQYLDNTASKCAVALYTATAAGGAITSLLTDSAGGYAGLAVLQFTGSDGIGAKNTAKGTSGYPSVSLTTTQDNSAVIVYNNDWNAVDGASRAWRTGAGSLTESNYFRDSAHYTVYIAYYADAGATGTKTVGLSAPSGQKYGIVALEIKGTAGSAPLLPHARSCSPDGQRVMTVLRM